MEEKLLNEQEVKEVNELNEQFVEFLKTKNLESKYTIKVEEIK